MNMNHKQLKTIITFLNRNVIINYECVKFFRCYGTLLYSRVQHYQAPHQLTPPSALAITRFQAFSSHDGTPGPGCSK